MAAWVLAAAAALLAAVNAEETINLEDSVPSDVSYMS